MRTRRRFSREFKVEAVKLVYERGVTVSQATVAGHGATAPVTVQSIASPVAAVVVAFDSTKISVGHVAQASAVVKDTAGNPITGQTVTWSSLTPNVASVSSSGTVTAIAAGMASIEATASGVNGSGTIAVEAPQGPAPAVAAVAVAIDSTKISVGHITQASAVVKDAAGNIMGGQTITWSSLTPGIASASASGVVTALAVGTASVRATASGISGSTSIIVAPPSVAVVTVTVDSTILAIGHTAQAYATAKDAAGNPINGQTIVWTSLSPTIASVSSSGKVTALAIGIAVIQATISGCSGSSPDITVTDLAAQTTFAAPDLASHNFDDGTWGPYTTWFPTDEDIVPDPTSSGRGNVARFHYVGTDQDRNRSLEYDHTTGLGQTIYTRGEFYLPPNVDLSMTNAIQRKLIYALPHVDYLKYPGTGGPSYWSVVTMFGSDLKWNAGLITQAGERVETMVLIGTIAAGRWYTIETQLTMNSTLAAQDGIFRVWLDGQLIYEKTDMRWTDPAWVGQPIGGTPLDANDLYFQRFHIGQQVNWPWGSYDEYRYWDNVAFSTKPIGQ